MLQMFRDFEMEQAVEKQSTGSQGLFLSVKKDHEGSLIVK